MRLSEFKAFLKEKKDFPLYLLVGREEILADRLVQAIKKDLLGPDPSEFDFTRFYGGVHGSGQIVSEARQISILASRRLIVVKEADRFSKEDQETLCDYAAAPDPSATVVFVAASLDKRTRFFKTLSQKGRLLDCEPPPTEELREWIADRCRREGKSVEPAAADWLVAQSGGQLTFLASEVEKLLLYCREKPGISEKDAEAICGKNPVKTVFNLLDAVSAKNRDGAYLILRELQQEGMAVPQLIGLLRWHLSRLWSGSGSAPAGDRLSRAYEAVLAADEEFKSGSGTEKAALDTLLYKLMK